MTEESTQLTEDALAERRARAAAPAPFAPGRPFELRRDGILLHRFEDIEGGKSARERASDMAFLLFGDAPEEVKKAVTVTPGGDFELHSSAGFCGSYATEAEAKAAEEGLRGPLERRRARRAGIARLRQPASAEPLTFEIRRAAP
jgi:hypothetical protein